MNKIVLLSALLLLQTLNAHAQSDKQALATKDTRVMYDMRGQGFNNALRFVVLNPQKLPVVVSVATDDKKFIEAVKQIIREMDWQGYEDISLVLNDPNHSPNKDTAIHELVFFKNGEVAGLLSKYKAGWCFGSVGSDKNRAITALQNQDEYPLGLIRTKIRTAHSGSGARNYAQD